MPSSGAPTTKHGSQLPLVENAHTPTSGPLGCEPEPQQQSSRQADNAIVRMHNNVAAATCSALLAAAGAQLALKPVSLSLTGEIRQISETLQGTGVSTPVPTMHHPIGPQHPYSSKAARVRVAFDTWQARPLGNMPQPPYSWKDTTQNKKNKIGCGWRQPPTGPETHHKQSQGPTPQPLVRNRG